MIPYPHPLTPILDPAESHPLGTWNHPTLSTLWTLAEMPLQGLIDDSAPLLQALKLDVPSSLDEAAKTLILIQQGLEASLLKADRDSAHIDDLLDHTDVDDIKATVKAFRAAIVDDQPADSAAARSLLDHIDGDWLQSAPTQTIRNYPMTALVKVLTTANAVQLLTQLRQALGWIGNDSSQTASGLMDLKLLIAAVRVQLDPRGDLLGFDLQAAALIGQSHDFIRREFQAYLLQKKQVQSAQCAIVANLALLEHFPSEFAILDIPCDLSYRNSSRWVKFRHGVELVEAIQPGAARTMSYKELAEFPLQVGLGASEQQQEVIGMALIPAVLSWARADATLSPTLPEAPQSADIQRILDIYLAQDADLQAAMDHVSAPIPKRFEIAKRLLKEQGIDPDQLYVNRPMPAHDQAINLDDYPHNYGIPAWEVIATCRWEPAPGPNTSPLIDVPKIPDWQAPPIALLPPRPHILDDPLYWHPYPIRGHGQDSFYPWIAQFQAPSALDVFEREFGQWRRDMREGYYLIIKRLLAELPLDDQVALMDGDVRVYGLHELVQLKASSPLLTLGPLARFGFVIQTRYQRQLRTFEVLPNTLQIIKRADLPLFDHRYHRVDTSVKGRFDFQAHSTGRSPIPSPQSKVELALQFGFLQPGLQHPVDSRIDQGEIQRQQRLEHIARKTSASLMYGSDEELMVYAKEQTRYERPHNSLDFLELLKNWVIPFWGSVEDVIEGVKTGSALKIFLGLLGIAFDVLAIIVPGVRAINQVTRIALLTANRSLRSSLIQATRVASTFLLRSGKDLIPVLSVVDLSKLAGRGALAGARGVLHLALAITPNKATLMSLRTTIKATPRRLRQLFTPSDELIAAWREASSFKLKAHGFQLRSVGQRNGVLVYNERIGARLSNYLVDGITGKPYGPPLTTLNDAGDLGLRGPAIIKLTKEGGGLSLNDSLPDLTKQWVKWGDDLYLDAGAVRYKYAALSDDTHVLKRTNAAALKRAEKLAPLACRPKRGLDADPCLANTFRNADFVAKSVSTAPGRGPVPWFNNRRITTDTSYKLIDREALWEIRDNNLLMLVRGKHYPAEGALAQVEVNVTGGNDLFKQISINGGVHADVADSRTVSGVVAQYKDSTRKVLVVRADDNLYYRADYTPGTTSLQMQRMTLSPDLIKNATTEDDYLALIHNGSGEAHRVISQLTPKQLADDLRLIEADLATRTDLNLGQFIGGPFNMHTSAAEAALFCKYTQTRLISHTMENSTYRFAINAETPLEIREKLAGDLNMLYRDSFLNADNILTPNILRDSTDRLKNLAYLHVRFKGGTRPERMYYSWSGARSKVRVPLAELEGGLRAGTMQAPRGWRLVPEGLEHRNVIYINAQPRKLPVTNSVLFLPDIQHRSFADVVKTNTRLLDSERSLVTRIKADKLDNAAIASVDAFTVRPTCQSCTIGLDGLKTEMAGVDIKLYEGPAKTRTAALGGNQS